jgi:hypothetical protein
MRVLSVRADSKKADIASGRAILADVIADPTTTVMVIQAKDPRSPASQTRQPSARILLWAAVLALRKRPTAPGRP